MVCGYLAAEGITMSKRILTALVLSIALLGATTVATVIAPQPAQAGCGDCG